MKLRGGNTTRKNSKGKNSKGKINIDDLYNSLMDKNMGTPVVRANSTRRKQANYVKQSKPETSEATRGVMHSYAIRHIRANNKGKTRTRSNTKSKSRGRSSRGRSSHTKSHTKSRSKSRSKSRGRSRGRSRSKSRGRSRSKSRGKIIDNRYNPYDSSSEFEKIVNDLVDKRIEINKNGVTKVKQSRGDDAPGTFGRSNR
jgi:hypothetical protein